MVEERSRLDGGVVSVIIQMGYYYGAQSTK
jgi:hypothetical protein